MLLPVRFLIAAFSSAVLTVIAAGPATGQYMFLDTDGDARNTKYQEWGSADTVQADLYVVSDMNRDDSIAACEPGEAPIELNG